MLLALVPCCIWANAYIIQRLVLPFTSPYMLLCFESIAILPFTLFCFIKYGKPNVSMKNIVIAAILWLFTYASVLQASNTKIYASVASVVGRSNVIISLFVSAIFLKEKISSNAIIGVIIGFMGLAVLAGVPNVSKNWIGFCLMLSFAFFWSIYMAYAKKYVNCNSKSFRETMYNTFVTTNCTIPFSLIFSVLTERGQWYKMGPNLSNIMTIKSIGCICFLAWGSFIGAICLWHYVNTKHPMNKVVPFCLAIPLITTLEAIFFFGEEIHITQILGTFLILSALFVIHSKFDFLRLVIKIFPKRREDLKDNI